MKEIIFGIISLFAVALIIYFGTINIADARYEKEQEQEQELEELLDEAFWNGTIQGRQEMVNYQQTSGYFTYYDDIGELRQMPILKACELILADNLNKTGGN